MTKPTCIIFNPKAGTAAKMETVRAKLEGLSGVRIEQTSRQGDGMRIARRAIEQGFMRLIALGGDGTVNEVLNGIAPDFDRVELGVAPLGTGNDFATLLGIPADPDDAIACLLHGETKPFDVAALETDAGKRYFLNASAGGFSSKVSEKLDHERKGFWGSIAFYLSAAEALPEMETYGLVASLDDIETIEVNCLNVVVANGRTVAGGIPVAPLAEPNDGLLDLLILPTLPAAELAALFAQLVSGNAGGENALMRRAQKIEITSDPPMTLNVDGELVSASPGRYTILPLALQIIIGPACIAIEREEHEVVELPTAEPLADTAVAVAPKPAAA